MGELLQQYFGYEHFRPMQEEVIASVLDKKDTVVIMSTGGGKSMCYQYPALQFEGVTIVISPLISLMKDQVDALRKKGIAADYINSTLSSDEVAEIQEKVVYNQTKLLYIAPERLALEDFREFLLGVNLSLIAIDEAHCISEWGHDFRQDYRNLTMLKQLFPTTPIVALTATATKKVQSDIIKQLDLKDPAVFVSSFDRTNLRLRVIQKKDSFGKILDLVQKQQDGATIIYCFSRKDCESIAQRLQDNGFGALPYHAGLSLEARRHNQELFAKNKVKIMVATIAFGMGIDKSDVRLIIHHTFSKTLESYYQEIGRAGRDGLQSDCVLFYSAGDMRKHEFFITQIPDGEVRMRSKEQLKRMMRYCEDTTCRRKHILNYFGEEYHEPNCGGCDLCVAMPSVGGELKPQQNSSSYDPALYEKLRGVRKELAKFLEVHSFRIFSNVALERMASRMPRTKAEFLQVHGVGPKKAREYGQLFLDAINEFVEQSVTA